LTFDTRVGDCPGRRVDFHLGQVDTGAMFWFWLNRFCGSYRCYAAARRARVAGGNIAAIACSSLPLRKLP
jgi:hypothetical protein